MCGKESVSEPLGKPLADQAGGDVAPAAGAKTDDDAHRPRRIGLRPCDPRDGRERDNSGSGELQKLAPPNFHGVPPLELLATAQAYCGSSIYRHTVGLDR